MICEYAQPNVDGQLPSCRTGSVLQKIIVMNGLSGVFTPVELRKEICNNSDPAAREQCPAHPSLQKLGRSSEYCK